MSYIAHITIMPLKELLDPQGKAVQESMHNLQLQSVNNVRIGKNIELTLYASSEEEAYKIAEEACSKILCNAVMEYYHITITKE